jgi:hypothetical protein
MDVEELIKKLQKERSALDEIIASLEAIAVVRDGSASCSS